MRATRARPGVTFSTMAASAFSESSLINMLLSPFLCSNPFTTISRSYKGIRYIKYFRFKISYKVSLTLYHPITHFNDPNIKSLLKTWWEKQNIFCFSHNVFYPSQKEFQFFRHIYFAICKCFQFGPVQHSVVW